MAWAHEKLGAAERASLQPISVIDRERTQVVVETDRFTAFVTGHDRARRVGVGVDDGQCSRNRNGRQLLGHGDGYVRRRTRIHVVGVGHLHPTF